MTSSVQAFANAWNWPIVRLAADYFIWLKLRINAQISLSSRSCVKPFVAEVA